MRKCINLPAAPNPFALAITLIIDLVRPKVAFRPMALQIGSIIPPLNGERPQIVIARSSHVPICESKMQIHAMFVLRLVSVEPSPRPRRKQLIAHGSFLMAE